MDISTLHVQGSNARLLNTLRSGSFVLFSVKDEGRKGFFTITIAGKQFTVRSMQNLVPGIQYRARLFKLNNKIELRILPDQNLQTKVLKDLSLPVNDTLKEIVTALMKSGLTVTPRFVQDLRRGSGMAGRKDASFLRLLTLLIDKGMPLSSEIVEFFSSLDGGDHGKQGSAGGKEKRETAGGSSDSDHDIKTPLSWEVLKKYVERDDEKKSPLKYFNHRKGSGDNWVIIPLGDLGNKVPKGLLKVNMGSKSTFKEFNLYLYGESSWEFGVKKRGESLSLRVSPPKNISDRTIKPLFGNFIEKLRKKGIEFTDIIKEDELSDGFNSTSEYVVRRIDRVV